MNIENLHPIMVHFPIALLTIYSLLEIASLFRKIRHNRTVWYIKLFLILVGRISIQAALTTGDAAGEAGFGVRNIIERHENFANISVWLYGISAIGYVLQWFLYDGITTPRGKKLISTVLHTRIQKIVVLYRRFGLSIILGIIGLVTLTVTGALGGAMVYGPEADPVVKMVMEFLHISY